MVNKVTLKELLDLKDIKQRDLLNILEKNLAEILYERKKEVIEKALCDAGLDCEECKRAAKIAVVRFIENML
ncbi:MAG: hypothetical protein WC179_06720 [Candidatus Cloacimonadaceae bacterium]